MISLEIDNAVLEQVLDSMPVPVFLVDGDRRIRTVNRKAAEIAGEQKEYYFMQKFGDAVFCEHSLETPEGCGTAAACKKCIARHSALRAIQGNATFQKSYRMQFVGDVRKTGVHLLVTATPYMVNGEKLALLVIEDVTELTGLQKLVPVCSGCKNVRIDSGYWQKVEDYISEHSMSEITGGLCPDCIKDRYGKDRQHNDSDLKAASA